DGSHFRFAVARFTSAGFPDSTFDSDGLVTTSIPTKDEALAYALAIQSDGKIVVGGKAFDGPSGYSLALARYTTTGALDLTFDGDGLRTDHAIPGNNEEISGLAIQTDGKIVITGTSQSTSAVSKLLIARYTTSGSLDSGFGTSGVVTPNFGANTASSGSSLTIQLDGKIVVLASVQNTIGGAASFGVVRLNSATASLDTSFAADALSTFSFP